MMFFLIVVTVRHKLKVYLLTCPELQTSGQQLYYNLYILRVAGMEQLDEQERNSLYNIIDGLFSKKKLKDTLSSALAQ